MMCSSASVQVCLDAGYEEPGPLGHGRRWWLAHQLGAVLVAAFAHSPVAGGGTRAGAPRGSPCGRPWTRDGPPRPRWAAIRALPGPGMSWTRR